MKTFASLLSDRLDDCGRAAGGRGGEDDPTGPRRAESPPALGTCRAPTQFVLVVDDDDDVRESIEDLLTLDGYEVVAVSNGEQAIGALAVATPIAVVTDLSMPVKDGHALVAHMRANARLQRVPVCVVSSDAAAAPNGTIRISKPFAIADLRRALRHLTAR